MLNRSNSHRCLAQHRFRSRSFNPFLIDCDTTREVVQPSRRHYVTTLSSPFSSLLRNPLTQTQLNNHNANDTSWVSTSPTSTSYNHSISFLPRQYYSTLAVETSFPTSFNFALQSPESLHLDQQLPGSSISTFSSSIPFNASAAVPVPSIPGKQSDSPLNSSNSDSNPSDGSASSFPFLNEASSSVEPLLVVIDLDETLFFSHLNPQSPHDFSIHVERQEIFVSLRPGCKEFLEWCSQHFHTGLYTAGTEGYAQALMEKIDPEGRLIRKSNHRYRQSCWPVHYEVRINQKSVIQTLYTKDLSLFRKDLSRVVLIDNSLFSFMLQPDNGIPIADWRGQLPPTPVEPSPVDKVNHDMTPAVSTSPASASGRDSILATQSKEEGFKQEAQQMKDDGSPSKTAVQEERQVDEPQTPHSAMEEKTDRKKADNIKEEEEGIVASSGKGKEAVSSGERDDDEAESISEDLSTTSTTDTEQQEAPISVEEEEKQRFGDFYLIKKTLEDLKDVEDVKPILRSKYRLVDHIIRRCISGMITSSRTTKV